MLKRYNYILILLLVLLVGCTAVEEAATFEGERALAWVERQCEFGYRTLDSEAHRQTGDMILAELAAQGWETREQVFTHRGVPVRNLLAWQGEGAAVLLGAHYDTRSVADRAGVPDPGPVMGANDGASGVAVLLELARSLEVEETGHTLYLAFFDAEDNGDLDGWDWAVGSAYMAEHWGESGEPPLQAVVVVDMIGDADQQVYYERNSHPLLSQEIWAVAATLGYGERIIAQPKYAIIDDHLPFVRAGIPAVDMIDFDYPYWHTTEDTVDKVSAESLEAIGRTLEVWLEEDREGR